jgi:chromosome segregation ATPase
MEQHTLRTAREQTGKSARKRDLRWPTKQEDSVWSPADRTALAEVTAERDQLREQLGHVRDLSSRLIDASEAQQDRICALESQIQAKDALIAALESENEVLITRLSSRETRISALESFLEMIAEADKRDP